MAKDRNGRELAVGQRVRIEATIDGFTASGKLDLSLHRIQGDPEYTAGFVTADASMVERIDHPASIEPPMPAEAAVDPGELLVMQAESDGLRPLPDEDDAGAAIGSLVFEPR